MATRRLTCIDIVARRPMSKNELLNLVKEELDKEFPTDVVEDSKITVTCNHEDVCPPITGKGTIKHTTTRRAKKGTK
jgi:hypothetical protein